MTDFQNRGYQQGGYQSGNQNRNRTESEPYRPSFTKNDFADATAMEINEIADKKGKEFARNIRTNQIRNFFAHINTLRNDFRNMQLSKLSYDQLDGSLILVKPKLAYAKGRNRNVEPFQQLIFETIDKVVISKNKEKAYINFFEFVEAIVAYHKYHGGREK